MRTRASKNKTRPQSESEFSSESSCTGSSSESPSEESSPDSISEKSWIHSAARHSSRSSAQLAQLAQLGMACAARQSLRSSAKLAQLGAARTARGAARAAHGVAWRSSVQLGAARNRPALCNLGLEVVWDFICNLSRVSAIGRAFLNFIKFSQ